MDYMVMFLDFEDPSKVANTDSSSDPTSVVDAKTLIANASKKYGDLLKPSNNTATSVVNTVAE